MASAMAQNTLSVVSTLSQQLTAVFVDDYGEIIEYLFETAQKRPQTTSNRDDFKFDDGEPRSFTIGASGVYMRVKAHVLCSHGCSLVSACSRWRRCVLLARIAY
jgi:hypothetical protein